jgi:hypothetical protein
MEKKKPWFHPAIKDGVRAAFLTREQLWGELLEAMPNANINDDDDDDVVV